ncbi:hypothetical protein NEOLEDRAFT_1068081 [Neolentinus lepideus HHB14362 ss-1]|uniref:DNA mismatch repair protein MSH3 n=1 Tax=Neolentinus lepideus HHB14362 ss-1 TaxID=1314782 RepID=A0A165RPX3_9AGAM|nr:hypothetical protein NEOLEDRAFT_1068081 [Neolentinus lepideus HHB14362 ss-1]
MPRQTQSHASPRGQSMISAYFSPESSPSKQKSFKRGGTSVIDLTSEGEQEPAAKKARISLSTSSPHLLQGSSKRAAADAEQWSFRRSSRDSAMPETHHSIIDEESRLARRESFKRKLLGENNAFVRLGRNDAQGNLVPDNDDLPQEEPEKDPSEDESDSGFKSLLSHFESDAKRQKQKGRSKAKNKVKELGPMGQPWTELEHQVAKLKELHPGILLMIEVGYKYVFWGEDAQIASNELGIVCYPKGNFLKASIPVERRDVHLKKLLAQGHKVGIVDQTETAALKQASETRNKLFSRKLNHLYTAATYVDELDSADDAARSSAPSLICLVEERKGGMGTDERVGIGLVVITPSTGDVIWDDFEDSHMRIELETRLSHTRPMEMLLPARNLSEATEKMISHFIATAPEGRKVQMERTKQMMPYSEAFNLITSFYTENASTVGVSGSFKSGQLLAAATAFPKRVVIALAHAIQYLSGFQLANVLIRTEYFDKFSTRTTMLLHGNTLTNLEIYRNETDHCLKGSLLSILDHTRTKFGSRLLRRWIGQPLVDISLLRERLDAVEELNGAQSPRLVALGELLKGLPDLAKGLCRIQYGYCTPKELAILLRAFQKIALAFPTFDANNPPEFKSKILQDILKTLPQLREPVQSILREVSLKSMEAGDKGNMWLDSDKYPDIAEYAVAVHVVEAELTEELKKIRKILKKPALAWTTVANEEYLIEVRKDENRNIPQTWRYITGTKFVRRYRTPEVVTKMLQRQQYIEAGQEAAKRAYCNFLKELAQKHYGILRDVVNKLAVADCLRSLALVGLTNGYVKPEFIEDDALEIVEGRHPVIEQLRMQPFVPNTVSLGNTGPRSKIITGPNMGGKSCCVKMIAVIVIMAQIGSFVPARSVRMSIVDGIFTRMGASDEIMKGRSTFMVEMTETSEILQSATSRSLVITDELGRGTSTFDGMAIAHAVLHHLIETVKCKTLFITHYPLVAIDIERQFPKLVQNLHMGFTKEARIDGSTDITFLYRLSQGLAEASFGIECARLANLPNKVLDAARDSAERMQVEVEARTRRNR